MPGLALANSPVDEVRARSQFDMTELQLAEKKIDAKQAATQMEALRFVWRGTDFEFDLLQAPRGTLCRVRPAPRRTHHLAPSGDELPQNPEGRSLPPKR